MGISRSANHSLAISRPPDQALRHDCYEVDEKLKGLRKKPLHDWASHAADAFRTAAVVIHKPEKGEIVNSVWNRPVAGRLRRMSAADNCRGGLLALEAEFEIGAYTARQTFPDTVLLNQITRRCFGPLAAFSKPATLQSASRWRGA